MEVCAERIPRLDLDREEQAKSVDGAHGGRRRWALGQKGQRP